MWRLTTNLLCLTVMVWSLAPAVAWGGAYYQQALQAYRKGAYAQAVQYAKKEAKASGATPDTVFLLGLISTKLKHYPQAEHYFEAVLKQVPADSDLARKARHNRGLVTRLQLRDDNGLSKQGNPSPAIATAQHRNLALMQQADTHNLSRDDNYLTLAIAQGRVVRWSTEAMPLKVSIANAKAPAQAEALVRKALAAWQQASKGALQFEVVASAQQADINVSWAGQLTHNRLGVSPFEAVGSRITKADVTVATHDPEQGLPLSQAALYQVTLHELGHALGLHGHSANPQDVMYFSTSLQSTGVLTARDVKTLGLLYALAPTITNDTHTASVADSRALLVTLKQLEGYLSQQAYVQAYSQSLAALKRYPNHPDVLFVAGVSQQAQGNPALAKHYYQQVLKVQPNHTATLANVKLLAL